MIRKYGWSKSILIHQVESQAYERFLLNQTNFDKTLEEKYRHQASLAVKDSYNFNFLDLREEYNERELEHGLIKNESIEFCITPGSQDCNAGSPFGAAGGMQPGATDMAPVARLGVFLYRHSYYRHVAPPGLVAS
jgi:hypothetical protein